MEKLNELRQKAKEFLEDIESICKDYKEKHEPEFKVGDWVIRKLYDEHNPEKIIQVDKITYTFRTDFWPDNEWYLKDSNGLYNLRHCTKEEIESHLKKICDEKYIGKKVTCLIAGQYFINEESSWNHYDDESDRYWMTNESDASICVYEQGHFAEIIPDKKEKPETKDEFKEFIKEIFKSVLNNEISIDDFLDSYDI